jgi:hypothetical protein
MKAIAQIVVAFAPCVLASAIPFMEVFRCRGKGFMRPFLLCWGLFVFWIFFFSLGLPGLASLLSRDLAGTVSDWVPEGPAVVLAAFMGWLYAVITIVLAVLARLFVSRFWPKLLSKNES